MTVMSKSAVDQTFMCRSCAEVIHPWSDDCVKATLMFAVSTLKGGIKFFSIMYAAHILFRMKSKKKIDYKKELKAFMRSLLFILIYGTSFIGFNCIFRNLLGRFNPYILFGLIPIVCGTAVFVESPGRVALNTTTFITGTFEGYYRSNLNQGKIKSLRLVETLIFMGLNGLLMYALRAQHEQNEKQESPWFFVPFKIKPPVDGRGKSECSHEGLCTRSLQMEITKFGGIAFLISFLKVLAMNIKTPSKILSKSFTWNTWKLTCFVSAYIGVFKVVSCYLSKTRGDSLQNTFIAGLLGGASYAISPNITILFSVLTALVKIIANQSKAKYNLPNLPYMKIAFVLTNFYMLYQRAFDKKSCPRYLVNMLNVVTLNKSEMINDGVHKMLNGQ